MKNSLSSSKFSRFIFDLLNVTFKNVNVRNNHYNKRKTIKIHTCLTDYPGSPSATYALVDDLDIVIKSPSGKVYVGNDKTSPYNDNWDGVNNVESVVIAVPENGTYTIEVQAYNVAQGGSQDFSLALIN